MTFEFSCRIKKTTVFSKNAAPVSSERFGHIDHFGIEFPDPLHFIVIIYRLAHYIFTVFHMPFLNNIASFNDQVAVYSATLEFRDHSEYKPGEFFIFMSGFNEEEF